MKVIRKDKNKILVRDDINESTQWFPVKKKKVHSTVRNQPLGHLFWRIVVHLIISRAQDKLEGFLFPKLFLSNVVAFSVT